MGVVPSSPGQIFVRWPPVLTSLIRPYVMFPAIAAMEIVYRVISSCRGCCAIEPWTDFCSMATCFDVTDTPLCDVSSNSGDGIVYRVISSCRGCCAIEPWTVFCLMAACFDVTDTPICEVSSDCGNGDCLSFNQQMPWVLNETYPAHKC